MNIIGGRDTLHPFAYAFLSACDYKHTLFSYEVNAVNNYVKILVGYNLWEKFVGLYPFVGRKSTLHSINLKQPGKYNIWWCKSALTHNEMGVKGNAAGFGNTLIALNQFKSHDIHLSVYNATNWTNASAIDYLIGAADGSAGNRLILRDSSINYTYNLGDDGTIGRIGSNGTGCLGPAVVASDSIYIPWEDFDTTPWKNWSCSVNFGSKFGEGYFGGELATEQVASQVFGHVLGTKSRFCFIQGDLFGHSAPATIPHYPTFLIESDWTFNNGVMAPIMLLRNGKFGTDATSHSVANLRMASVGYGFTPAQSVLFFEATQAFEQELGRSVDRIYLGQSDQTISDSIIISESAENVITDIGTLPVIILGDNFVVNAIINKITILGPRIYSIVDTPLETSVEIISFIEE